jgi:hypothetical protein
MYMQEKNIIQYTIKQREEGHRELLNTDNERICLYKHRTYVQKNLPTHSGNQYLENPADHSIFKKKVLIACHSSHPLHNLLVDS